MAENIPHVPAGAVPPKKETGKVQPKKETVRINLPPKPSAAPTIKLPTLPPATLGLVHETVPVPPTAGVVQVHPAGGANDKNVVFVGIVSEKVAVVAADPPEFVTA